MFGHGHGNARDVHFLKTVAPQICESDVARNGDEGDAVHVRGGDARHEIGRARTRSCEAHAHLSADARVAVRGVRGALFVRSQNVADTAVPIQSVVNIQNAASGISENGVDVLFLQTAYDNIRSAQFHDKKLP